MAVQLDTSKALLRLSQLEALVAAVLVAHDHDEVAHDHDEDDWPEWKGGLDLTLKDAKEHIAKQVLDFSNRTVATAPPHADGYAYLLVGVEPGSLVGVDTIDNADLVSGTNRYVGDGPRWTPERISSGDKTRPPTGRKPIRGGAQFVRASAAPCRHKIRAIGGSGGPVTRSPVPAAERESAAQDPHQTRTPFDGAHTPGHGVGITRPHPGAS
ncbi:hypothetical protein [Pseudonocardia sp. H11422]|uniref:hypothetical protein n=1 Tax=Pseudonocardia sp. H11422 TaxID=2835866 RepID=UPI001BDC76EF|nr:hypothetical protein [Pseudonocardia sp. H11422]